MNKLTEVELKLDGITIHNCYVGSTGQCNEDSDCVFTYLDADIADTDTYEYFVRPCKYHLELFKASSNFKEVV